MRGPFATFGVITLTLGSLYASSSSQQNPPTFRSGVNVVQMDVSVLDEQRRPIPGLSAADFEVREDGKLQRIVAFTPVDVPEPAAPDTPWAATVSPDVASNSGAHTRLFLIILDDATIPFEVQMMNTAKEAARRVVERMGPKDLAAIVFTADNRNAQDFTGDKPRLLAAIDTFRAGWHSHSFEGVANPDVYFQGLPPKVLVKAVEFLSEVTERRKALVFISNGVSTPSWYDINKLYRLAQGANVSIYPVDPSGFGMSDYIQNRLLQKGARADEAMDTAFKTSRRRQDKLRSMATNTGGYAVLNTNDFGAGIDEIHAQTSGYYLIGYESSHKQDAFRRTEVRVRRPGADVKAKQGTWAPPKQRKADTLAESAIAGVLPKADLPLRLNVAPFSHNDDRASVAVVLGFDEPSQAAAQAAAFDVVIGAFDPEGRDRGTWRHKVTMPRAPGVFEPAFVIDLKPGRYAIRVGVQPHGTSASGSVYADLLVPDFAKERLTLSAPLLSVGGTTTSPSDANKLPLVPTSRRRFSIGEAASSFVRIHQGGEEALAPVTLKTRIVNANNDVVFESEVVFGASQFGSSRSADIRQPLPLTRLPNGDYLLTFSALAADVTTQRAVAFAVGQ